MTTNVTPLSRAGTTTGAVRKRVVPQPHEHPICSLHLDSFSDLNLLGTKNPENHCGVEHFRDPSGKQLELTTTMVTEHQNNSIVAEYEK